MQRQRADALGGTTGAARGGRGRRRPGTTSSRAAVAAETGDEGEERVLALDDDVLEDAVEVRRAARRGRRRRRGRRLTTRPSCRTAARRTAITPPQHRAVVRGVAPIRLQPAGGVMGSEAMRIRRSGRREMETVLRGVLRSRYRHPGGGGVGGRRRRRAARHPPRRHRGRGGEERCLSTLGAVPEPAYLPAALRRLLEDAAAGSGDWRPRLEGLGDFQRRVLLETCEIPPW